MLCNLTASLNQHVITSWLVPAEGGDVSEVVDVCGRLSVLYNPDSLVIAGIKAGFMACTAAEPVGVSSALCCQNS